MKATVERNFRERNCAENSCVCITSSLIAVIGLMTICFSIAALGADQWSEHAVYNQSGKSLQFKEGSGKLGMKPPNGFWSLGKSFLHVEAHILSAASSSSNKYEAKDGIQKADVSESVLYAGLFGFYTESFDYESQSDFEYSECDVYECGYLEAMGTVVLGFGIVAILVQALFSVLFLLDFCSMISFTQRKMAFLHSVISLLCFISATAWQDSALEVGNNLIAKLLEEGYYIPNENAVEIHAYPGASLILMYLAFGFELLMVFLHLALYHVSKREIREGSTNPADTNPTIRVETSSNIVVHTPPPQAQAAPAFILTDQATASQPTHAVQPQHYPPAYPAAQRYEPTGPLYGVPLGNVPK
eukprot:TRINITY_DN6198_c0_g2_i1.p1 TRINITY_DN6198_c0_g2~~TRINITY_DN6198_c0_g2_i1.p1  ORF type:complete len:359 (+),score=83.24 TRINITY_DN6198_c0_g2_i1:50-1126(+)